MSLNTAFSLASNLPETPLKRRDFLAASALFSLFAGDSLASPQTKPAKAKKKPAAKPKKKPRSTSNARAASASRPANSATTPVIDNPPDGTSSSRLPPSRALELPTDWKTYEITVSVQMHLPQQRVQLWIPLPGSQDSIYQRTLSHTWRGKTDHANLARQPDGLLEVFHAEWSDAKDVQLVLSSQVSTADRHFDVARRTVPPDRDDILRRNLQATRLIPNEGLSRQLGERIVGRIKDPLAQVKAIYDWICENAIYDPAASGCGTGDVNQQLIRGEYGGRSADINSLFVSVCRSMGIPARCVYGIRTGPSRLFRSLGLSSDEASNAQHVRAEFYLPGYGWIPVDPSDVRRAVALEVLSEQDPRFNSIKRVLFGVWEMNWVAFHTGNEIHLPGVDRYAPDSQRPFFITPTVWFDQQLREAHDFPGIKLSIHSRQIEL